MCLNSCLCTDFGKRSQTDFSLDISGLVDVPAVDRESPRTTEQHHDLLRLFETGGFRPENNHCFFEVCVDCGRHNPETIVLLFSYQCKQAT